MLFPLRDAQGRIVDFRIECANRAWRRQFGATEQSVDGRGLYEVFPAAAARRGLHAMVMETGAPATGLLELTDSRTLEYRASRAGEVLIVSTRDVSDRVRAARELRVSVERYRTLVESLDAIVSVDDIETGTTWVSAQAERILGYPPARVAERGFWRSLVVPEDRARTAAVWDRHAGLDDYDLEYRARRADGATIWLHDRMKCIRDTDGRIVRWYGVTFDVTSLKALRQQAIRSERMEAVGQFASGIAHDLNDLLLGISLFNNFVRETIGDDDPRRPDLEQITATVERGRTLLSRLVAFSSGQEVAPAPVDPVRVVRDFVPMVRRLAGDSIVVHVAARRHVGRVLGDRTQLEQIILNLASNAAHAMPEGGRLDIELSDGRARGTAAHASRAREPDVGATGTRDAGWVRIVVRDTGVGMSPSTTARIFDPFFTTRERGSGAGLGLTTVHSIVESLGGSIDVTSAPGAGTAFEVLLPRVEGGQGHPPTDPPPPSRRPRTRARPTR